MEVSKATWITRPDLNEFDSVVNGGQAIGYKLLCEYPLWLGQVIQVALEM